MLYSFSEWFAEVYTSIKSTKVKFIPIVLHYCYYVLKHAHFDSNIVLILKLFYLPEQARVVHSDDRWGAWCHIPKPFFPKTADILHVLYYTKFIDCMHFPWDQSRSAMLTQKGDILGTKQRLNTFWAGKVDRSIPTIYFFKSKIYTVQNFHAEKNYCHASKRASYQIKRFENCCLYLLRVHVHLTIYVFKVLT